jgi:hypothetical protein
VGIRVNPSPPERASDREIPRIAKREKAPIISKTAMMNRDEVASRAIRFSSGL